VICLGALFCFVGTRALQVHNRDRLGELRKLGEGLDAKGGAEDEAEVGLFAVSARQIRDLNLCTIV